MGSCVGSTKDQNLEPQIKNYRNDDYELIEVDGISARSLFESLSMDYIDIELWCLERQELAKVH